MKKVDGDRVRHCKECDLDVYDLSEMSRRDTMRLVEEHEGHLCVRFYRRRDGTILTQECPVGFRRTFAGVALAGLNLLGAALMLFPPFKEIVLGMGKAMGPLHYPEEDCPPDLQDLCLERYESRGLHRENLIAHWERTGKMKRQTP